MVLSAARLPVEVYRSDQCSCRLPLYPAINSSEGSRSASRPGALCDFVYLVIFFLSASARDAPMERN